mmetsp:Transcript_9755/g.39539  ORF Transcript_9755/g.39539 Transcript_9755/m.39539 type:complete len:216 (+) Transcript_9755:1044-1691(+)
MPRRPIDEQYSFVYSSNCPFPTSVSDPGTFTPCRPVGKKSSPTAPSGLAPWLMIPYIPRRCDRPTGSGTFFGPRFIRGFMSSGLAARDIGDVGSSSLYISGLKHSRNSSVWSLIGRRYPGAPASGVSFFLMRPGPSSSSTRSGRKSPLDGSILRLPSHPSKSPPRWSGSPYILAKKSFRDSAVDLNCVCLYPPTLVSMGGAGWVLWPGLPIHSPS